MKRISRYVLRKFFQVFLLALATFVGLYLLVDFFEKVDDLMEHRAPLWVYFSYFAAKIPLIVVQVSPMAVLMGVFMTIGGLSRTSELTALWASGVSLVRTVVPLIGAGLLISLTVLLANENLVPLSVRTMNHLWATEVDREPGIVLKKDRLWLREGDAIINVALADPDQGVLHGVSIFRFDQDFGLRERTFAEEARFESGRWRATSGTRYRFSPESGQLLEARKLSDAPLELAREPAGFQFANTESEELNFRQLRARAQKLTTEGYDPSRLRVDMHNRLAAPFAAVIMAFIGIPFALRKGRSGSVALGVAVTIAIGFGYLIVQAVGLALGYASLLPAVIAAWATNLLFLLFGLWLLLANRSG